MLTTDTIELILRTLPGKTVAVLGDLFLDRYLDLDGSLTEPSLETVFINLTGKDLRE